MKSNCRVESRAQKTIKIIHQTFIIIGLWWQMGVVDTFGNLKKDCVNIILFRHVAYLKMEIISNQFDQKRPYS
jgi:hypothetical protein